MLWAIVENRKLEAIPKRKGTCPLCERTVFSRCGEVNVWHWAHVNNDGCDQWYEPETFWHLHWKMTFGRDNAEVVISKNGKRHIADIQTKGNVIIELQNSPIQKSTIREREEFYGERMFWLINGSHFKENFHIMDYLDNGRDWWKQNHIRIDRKSSRKTFEWSYGRKSWSSVQRNVFIDFGGNSLFRVMQGMGTKTGNGIYVSKKAFIDKYGGDYEYYCQQNKVK